MITRAGVDSTKVVVGVTSYGRSFQIASAGCTGPDCTYTGTESGATPGRCTKTPGYISDAEIKEIMAQNPNVQTWNTGPAGGVPDTDILLYDNDQWVSYMSPTTKGARKKYYESLNFGGTSDWAMDLEDFHVEPPK